jgi:hypothetical protein
MNIEFLYLYSNSIVSTEFMYEGSEYVYMFIYI